MGRTDCVEEVPRWGLQRHWAWQENRRTDLNQGFFRYNTAFMASLDVKTAFDVAKPSVVSKILCHGSPWTRGGGPVDRNAERARCETEFRYSRCTPAEVWVKLPVLWGRVLKYVFRKAIDGSATSTYSGA